MPFNTPLPDEGTDPWYTPFVVNFVGGLRDFVNMIEGAVGQPSGIASLGPDGKLPTAQLPAIAISQFKGSVATQAAMLAVTGEEGDWVIRTDKGTVFIITGNPAVIGGWTEMAYPTAPVLSVNGKAGVVSLVPLDIGAASATDLNNVNTKAEDAQNDATQALADAAGANTNANGRVPTSRTVAGHALTADVARAALATVGIPDAVFIANGGTVPAGTPAYTIVIEAGA